MSNAEDKLNLIQSIVDSEEYDTGDYYDDGTFDKLEHIEQVTEYGYYTKYSSEPIREKDGEEVIAIYRGAYEDEEDVWEIHGLYSVSQLNALSNPATGSIDIELLNETFLSEEHISQALSVDMIFPKVTPVDSFRRNYFTTSTVTDLNGSRLKNITRVPSLDRERKEALKRVKEAEFQKARREGVEYAEESYDFTSEPSKPSSGIEVEGNYLNWGGKDE